MPTYDYECDACGHKFERFQPITARAVRKCPMCKKLKVRRLLGAGAGIIFKGSGFYQTDYRSESYRKQAEKEAKPAGDSSGASGDSKPTKGAEPAKKDAKAKTEPKSCWIAQRLASLSRRWCGRPNTSSPKMRCWSSWPRPRMIQMIMCETTTSF